MLQFSVIIPCFDERASLPELHARLTAVFSGLGSYEFIFVDDGSRDGSFQVIRELFEKDSHVRGIQFRRNQGKSAALAEGFRAARGSIVVMIDADLQDEPNEIPKLVKHLEHVDLVTGWKQVRNDPWTKTFPSKLFNGTARKLFGVKLNDLNSGLKVMRAEVAKSLELYGEQHRFIPILAAMNGYKADELPVIHHERKFGRSKYGWKRFVRGSLDLVTMAFLSKFQQRPMHLFGAIGGLFFAVGIIIGLYLSVVHFQGESIGSRPLLTFGVLSIITGLQFLFTGLLAELITNKSERRRFPIRETLDHDRDSSATS